MMNDDDDDDDEGRPLSFVNGALFDALFISISHGTHKRRFDVVYLSICHSLYMPSVL